MPSKKQRRRAAKERRHEYETVWLDEEGNETDEPPEEAAVATRERRDETKGKPKSKAQQQRGGRVPPEPSWSRAIRRSVIWVVVLGALLVWVQSRSAHPNYAALVPVAVAYVVLFPVMTYYIDRSMYRRYQSKQQRDGAKKR